MVSPIKFRTTADARVREPEPTVPEPALSALLDDIPPDSDARKLKDPYLQLIIFMNEQTMKLFNRLADDNHELRDELVGVKAELASQREENKLLRDLKPQFMEVRARASESDAKVERLAFQLERIAADRRGPPGIDGKDGRSGARGLRGEKGAMGPAGVSGVEFARTKRSNHGLNTPLMTTATL
jgi:hypothetical protein